ncbi:MAG: tetratricopeptide repeat protein [Gemmataceae bacterium]|nr:tetratricopeptide repeat protein [Gemmataceae bacterium]
MTLRRWLLAVFALSGAGFALAQVPFVPRAVPGRGRVIVVPPLLRVPLDPRFYRPRVRISYVTVLAVVPPPPVLLPREPSILDRVLREAEEPSRREEPEVPEVPEVPKEELPPPPPPKKEEKPLPPPPKPKPEEGEPVLPGPVEPFDDPAMEARRQTELGRADFAARQYGRAASRFRRAAALQPREAPARFLLAQSLLAMGKHHDAYDALAAGLRLDPAWPKGPFRAIDLYGADVRSYPEHLRQLEETLGRFPAEPVLLFLSGWAAWSDGRQEEGAALMRRAGPAFAESAEPFLRALPGGGV